MGMQDEQADVEYRNGVQLKEEKGKIQEILDNKLKGGWKRRMDYQRRMETMDKVSTNSCKNQIVVADSRFLALLNIFHINKI